MASRSFGTNFLTPEQAVELAKQHGTPLFVYSHAKLMEQARALSGLDMPYGYIPRYAMKANPHPEVLQIFRGQGLGIDASSGYETQIALESGFAPEQILLTSQELPPNLEELVAAGVQFNATSLHQLEVYGRIRPGSAVSVRLNPGIGSGFSTKVTVGGPNSSFGIWHEYLPQVLGLAKKFNLQITRLHSHIGVGTDPVIWQQAAQASLELAKQLPDVAIINLGGGFKIARMDDEPATDITALGKAVAGDIRQFYETTGRKLHVELEPGSWLAANAGVLLARVEDIVDTGQAGYTFLKLNTGMNDILRPSLYGAQHPIAVVNDATATVDYVVVGHNCESGDLLTPAAGEPEVLAKRTLAKADIGDLVLIGGVGAYCASMATHGYNSFPPTKELII